MVNLKKIEITKERLLTVTKEPNPFDYVNKAKTWLNKGRESLIKSIPDIESRIEFSSDNKSISIDTKVIAEIQKAYDGATGIDKANISKAKQSLFNCLYGKNQTVSFKQVW